MAPGGGRDFNCTWEHCNKVWIDPMPRYLHLPLLYRLLEGGIVPVLMAVVLQSQIRSVQALSDTHQ